MTIPQKKLFYRIGKISSVNICKISSVNCKKTFTLMIFKLQTEKGKAQAIINKEIEQETENEKILCSHCQRTATNGIKCKGICVADSDY